MKAARAVAPLVGLVSALTLAACGVPPSGVIQAGTPASGMYVPRPTPATPTPVLIYFVHDGVLRPFPRKIVDPGDFGAVVRFLFYGPIAGEARTATTELPRLKATPEVEISGDANGNTLSVKLPQDVPPLTHLAMLQLVCTVAHMTPPTSPALPTPGTSGAALAAPAFPTPQGQRPLSLTGVQVTGNGWTITQSDTSCPDPPSRP
ncbi:hypothetical protein [Actinacidiphila acididurans]|uniref:Lipoprotein n=1 Tax=Actinacidiphila acididurans TaxID=2784346 RepID=A0ABS2U0X7_9ACTN|nr:hypothetical protein [Actinacidiphila acididurans]MBM9507848.1 hypothetical protein [Actinacidiphila acididurans]